MGSAQQYIFPSAIFASIILAAFTFLVTSGMAAPADLSKPFPFEVTASVEFVTAPGYQEEISLDEQSIEEPTSGENGEQGSAENQAKCKVSKKYPNQILQWCQLISRYAKNNNLDPDLIAALIWQESGGDAVAYSRSGAVGLMQVMPRDWLAAAFMCINGPCFANRPAIKELQDPDFNIKFGTGMLSGLVAKYGDLREGLKYYGPKDVGYYYADKVLGIYQEYKK